MEKFSAHTFHHMGILCGDILQALDHAEHVRFPTLQTTLFKLLQALERECSKIGLRQSALSARRFIDSWGNPPLVPAAMRATLESLTRLIDSEMTDHLFFWVPSHRAEWYDKSVEDIAGTDCMLRFPSVWYETEEAAKCFSFGRYTASAFHLSRATEAGMQALARAIQFVPPNNNWNLVFRQVGSEFHIVQTKPLAQWPLHWQTHRDFLETLNGDLRAISKAWRNDIAHLVDKYTEEEAKELLFLIPIFLRHMATKMDEQGKLY